MKKRAKGLGKAYTEAHAKVAAYEWRTDISQQTMEVVRHLAANPVVLALSESEWVARTCLPLEAMARVHLYARGLA